MPPPPAAVYRFGLFEADSRTGELRKHGRLLKLRGRPFDILILLLERQGDVITRDELRQQLWAADTFVDFDHGLNSAVNRLREAIGDSAENPRFIETLPRRGYRFISPVEVVAKPGTDMTAPVTSALETPRPQPVTSSDRAPAIASDAPGSGLRISRASRPVLLMAAGALLIALTVAALYLQVESPSLSPTSKRTLAVLPFQNLGDDAEWDFFSDGFTEEMIAELGKLDPDRLGVIARTTSILYKNAQKDIGQIKRELGVDYVLEGSIRRAASRVRITAQLVQTTDMTQLWAETYDRDVSDVLAIQSEVAMRISRSLALAINRPSADSGGHTGAASFPAYELTLRAKFFREQATEEGARKAIEFFERAIALDPGYAPAHAGLADCYRLLGAPGWEVDQPRTLLQRAKVSAEHALSLDMQSSDAHAVLAMVKLNYDWDLIGSEREIQEAIRLNPNSAKAHQYYSSTLTAMSRFDDAIKAARRALELDPLAPTTGTTLAIRYAYAGRTAEAMEQFVKTLEINPGFAVAHLGLAQGYRVQGNTLREIEELQRAVELSGNSAYMRAHLAYGLARAGDRSRALAIKQELESAGQQRYQSPYHLALIAAGLGDQSQVFRSLERAFADRSGWLVFLPVEPEFSALRQAPEIQSLLARVKPLS